LRIDSHHSFSERYPLDHLASILARNRFDGSVVVAEVIPPEVSLDFIRAVVVRSDSLDPRRLDEYQRHTKFRGVCHSLAGGIPDTLAELERRGISLDADGGLASIPRIAERFPSLRIAIDHLGGPPAGEWEHDLERAAGCPQVFCKLSGLTRLRPSPRPYVQHALAVFGPRRLMFGSDWPACLPEFTWKASLAAFTQAIGAQSIEVREELLGATAARFYGLGDKLE
jgi:L-fuconolactonase